MIFKLVGLGINNYVRDGFNLFDAFVVFVSLIEILMSVAGSGENSGLSVFRTFRLFRVFKLIRSWDSLRILMITILNSLAKVSTAAVLLLKADSNMLQPVKERCYDHWSSRYVQDVRE